MKKVSLSILALSLSVVALPSMAQTSASISGTVGIKLNRGSMQLSDGHPNAVFVGSRLEAADQTGMESVLANGRQVWQPTYAKAPLTVADDSEFLVGVPASSTTATSASVSSATAKWSAAANGTLSFALTATTAASGGYANAYSDLWLQFVLAPLSKVTVSISSVMLSVNGQDAGVFPATAFLNNATDSSTARLMFDSQNGTSYSDALLSRSNIDGYAYEAEQGGGGSFVFSNTSTANESYYSLRLQPSVSASSFQPAAVPEPQTYAMMLLGLVGIVGIARRKRSQA